MLAVPSVDIANNYLAMETHYTKTTKSCTSKNQHHINILET